MLDIKFIRDNPDLIKKAAERKGFKVDIDRLLILDQQRRTILRELEEKRADQNQASHGGFKDPSRLEELRRLKGEIKELERKLNSAEKEFNQLMLLVPQVPDDSVPDGQDDRGNKKIRQGGKPPNFNFPPKDYLQLMANLDLVDLERGAKVVGFRGYFLKNEGFLLSNALWQFTLEHFCRKGFTVLGAPAIAKEFNLMGTGWLPQGRDEVYKIGPDEYLAGTAEVTVMGFHAGEIFNQEELPRKYLAFSPCFRSEAGSYGKDTKGILRVHEFFKLEQVVLCLGDHQESVKWHEAITKNSEEILQALKLPYRVVINCAGDLGLGQVKKYDLETWLPSQQRYCETHSSSYFHDFQTRRLNIRYRDYQGKIHFTHSLNNTALATPRILAQILENYQTKSGTVKIPAVLQKYMFGLKEIKPTANPIRV